MKAVFFAVLPHSANGRSTRFEFFGGVPKKVIYDNLTLAVKRRYWQEQDVKSRKPSWPYRATTSLLPNSVT